MVLIIKNKNYKSFIRKILSFVILGIILIYYYTHMSDQFKEENIKLAKELELQKKLSVKKRDVNKVVSRIIYKEAENCVELIGQKYIQDVRVVKDRLIITCDWDTNLEPLFIRYGVLALVKSTLENKKIAIELKYIVENKYED